MKIGLSFVLLSLLIVSSSAAQSAESDDPEANPDRPTVSTPATPTPVGYLQFETGVLGASDSPEFSSRYGFNEVMKLSVTPWLELITSKGSVKAASPCPPRGVGQGLFDKLQTGQTWCSQSPDSKG
jgi:hypothetical protein